MIPIQMVVLLKIENRRTPFESGITSRVLGLVILEKFYVVYYRKKRQNVANYSLGSEENKGLSKKRGIRISSSYAEGDRR